MLGNGYIKRIVMTWCISTKYIIYCADVMHS